MLLLRGENDVTVMEFSMGSRWCTDPRVSFICGDISLLEDSVVACRGREAVFLTAAAPAFTDKIQYQYEKSFRVNAVGCDNIIKACIVCDVNFLILSSTLLVTARCGLGSAVTVSETDPFVDHDSCMCYYASGKALAEQLVHRAHGMVHENHMTELNTIALRIPAAFGAKDDCIVQQMLQSNECMYLGFDSLRHWSYIDNVAFAHLLGLLLSACIRNILRMLHLTLIWP